MSPDSATWEYRHKNHSPLPFHPLQTYQCKLQTTSCKHNAKPTETGSNEATSLVCLEQKHSKHLSVQSTPIFFFLLFSSPYSTLKKCEKMKSGYLVLMVSYDPYLSEVCRPNLPPPSAVQSVCRCSQLTVSKKKVHTYLSKV